MCSNICGDDVSRLSPIFIGRTRRILGLLCVPAIALLIAACGTDSESQVATLADPSGQPAESSSPSATDDGGLAFASCMRGKGVDVPDPDPDGGFGSRGDSDIDVQDPDFRKALSECQDLLPAGNPLNRTFDARQQEAILDLVGCLRKNGIDAPDPQFDVNGKLIPTGAIDPGDPKLRKALQECRSQAAAIGAN